MSAAFARRIAEGAFAYVDHCVPRSSLERGAARAAMEIAIQNCVIKPPFYGVHDRDFLLGVSLFRELVRSRFLKGVGNRTIYVRALFVVWRKARLGDAEAPLKFLLFMPI